MLISGVDVIEATWRPRCRPRADMAPRGMQRLSSSFALVVVLVVPTWSALSGCAARFQGELDGDLVPSFSSAAFALREGTVDAATVTGFAVQGDSCAEALTFTGLQQRSLEATSEDRRDQTATAQADWFSVSNDTVNGAIVLTAIPEPSTYGMSLAGLALALAAIRRRNKRKTAAEAK